MAKDNSKYETFAAIFVGEANFNATLALELMGKKAKNRHSLQESARQLLNRPEVQLAIRKHLDNTKVTQEKVLEEMQSMAFWNHQDALVNASGSMEEAKVFDTMMRAKVKTLGDFLKLFSGDLAQELAKVRKAIEEHRKQYPEMSESDRTQLFSAHVDPKMVQQVMTELLSADENRKRLEEMEAEAEDPLPVKVKKK